MSYYKPLTPKLRNDILDSINSQISELNTCQQTAFVSAQKSDLMHWKIYSGHCRTDIRFHLKGLENNGTALNRKSRHKQSGRNVSVGIFIK